MPETVFMFSGQGSQYFHMGRSLYFENRTFRCWMLHLDELQRRVSGSSVVGILYAKDRRIGDSFDRTLLTHPAIFMVEYSLAQSLIQAGVRPDMVLGVSLGSFAAAAVAGFLGVEDALDAVMQQALAFEECCEPGGMTAVLASPELFSEEFLREHAELASVNFASHFVVSARLNELTEIEAALKRMKICFQRLPVSMAFHSQWIENAKVPFESFMKSIWYGRGRLPMVCCDHSAVLSKLPDDYFWDVVRRPARFHETTARLETQNGHRYVDVGPGSTLATFLKYGLPAGARSTIHPILTPFGVDQKSLGALLESARQ